MEWLQWHVAVAQEEELYREVMASITQQLPYTPYSRLSCSLVHKVRCAAAAHACKEACVHVSWPWSHQGTSITSHHEATACTCRRYMLCQQQPQEARASLGARRDQKDEADICSTARYAAKCQPWAAWRGSFFVCCSRPTPARDAFHLHAVGLDR